MSFLNRAPHSQSTSSSDLPLGQNRRAIIDDNDTAGAADVGSDSLSQPPPSRTSTTSDAAAPTAAIASSASASVTANNPPLRRLVVRDLPYHQSSNSLRIRHQSKRPLRFYHWYVEDWFHVALRLRTAVSIFLFVLLWTTFLLIFSAIYHAVDRADPSVNCGLGVPPDSITFYTAFAFSLETTTTVGYGLPNGSNGFFESCPGLQVAIYFQMLISMFMNAFLLSFVFARMSRCEARAAQVLFSDKAILNREILPGGITRYNLSARVFDADSKYPIVEAHVRMYAVKHGAMHSKTYRHVRHPMNMEPMRISIPNDDLGAVLYTSVPSIAVHHIDYQSPLCPPSKRNLGPEDGRVDNADFVMNPCGLNLRENDSYTGGQDGLRCVICGETYGTVANLIQHIRYNQHVERHDDVPVEGSHQELDVEALFRHKPLRSRSVQQKKKSKLDREEGVGLDVSDNGKLEEIGEREPDDTKDVRSEDIERPSEASAAWFEEYRDHLKKANVEIICVVEAIDPLMSGTFQAIQSYTLDDIVFHAEFAPCMIADEEEVGAKDIGWLGRCLIGRSLVGRSVKVDLDSFHKVEKRI